MPKIVNNFENYYEPFGEEWRNEMMKLTKDELIKLLRKSLLAVISEREHHH